MSGTRRTEDFNAVTTRQLNLINPDGSFPAQGELIGVTDRYGTLGPTPNPVFRHLSADTLTLKMPMNQATVNATTVVADTVQTNTLDITNKGRLTTYDLCANRVETVYLTVEDICAGCITVDTIYPRQLGSAGRPAEVVNVVQVNAMDINASVSIITPYLKVSSIDAQDISATWLDTQRITTTDLATNTISRAETINVRELNASNATIGGLVVSNTANINTVVSRNINATNINAVNTTVSGTLITSGNFFPASINTTGTITADRIQANDISASSIYGATATFDVLNATVLDISGTNYNNILAPNITGTKTIKGLGTLDISGATSLHSTTATSIAVSGLSTLNNVTATQINTPSITIGTASTNTTSEIKMFDTKSSSTGLIPNPGVLTYDVSNGLLLNGRLVSTSASFSNTVPFSLVTAKNNLETVSDISATLVALINSYNSFLTIFSNAKIIIQLTPVVNFLSPCSIQFTIRGEIQPPIVLFGTYTLGSNDTTSTTLVSILTQAAKNAINFQALPDSTNIWRVRITVDNIGNNTYISDVSGLPTGSLQVLRYLGYNVPIDGGQQNVYETYALNGAATEYTLTTYPLIAGNYPLPNGSQGSALPSVIQFVSNLPDVSYNVSPDPYSFPITFKDLSNNPSVLYLAIKNGDVYKLYPKNKPLVTFGGLRPNTGYPFIFNYLDLSNNSSVSPTLTTTRIPAPTDVSANENDITFNSFTLRWTQPYAGRTYTFNVTAVGPNITPSRLDITPPLTYFPLVQNTQYRITVISKDTEFDSLSNISQPVFITTKALVVPTPVITAVPNSNVTALVSWNTPVTAGASGKLEYNINNGSVKEYNIPGPVTSFTILDLSGVGDVSSSLIYTDNQYNTIRGSRASYTYDTSFGFYDMSAVDMSSPQAISLNNTSLDGIGYVFPTNIQNPWIGYTFNKIMFPKGILKSAGSTVTFRANVYNIPSANIAGIYSGPGYTVSPFDLLSGAVSPPAYSPYISSSSVTISTSTIQYPVLTFTQPVVFTANTVVMFEIIAGSGTLIFSTFLNSSAIAKNAYATSIAYVRTFRSLNNWSIFIKSSVICQFSYV